MQIQAKQMLGFYSLVTTPIEVLCVSGKVINRGTAFFYKRDANWIYLVTNWHLVTCRSPLKPMPLNPLPVPVAIRLAVHENIGEKGIALSNTWGLEVDINSADGNAPRWLEHPEHRFKVDVVVLRIPANREFSEKVRCSFLAEYPILEQRLNPEVMDDVFVIGYPMGLSGGGSVLPLYKRGSIATEPLVNHNGLPRLLIDCRTDKGMSGSPVVFRRSGPWSPNGKLDDETHFETVENFLGVYAGRLIDPTANGDAKESDRISEIGVVWKRSALDALVERGVEGTKLIDL